jgi:hypothetical protein
VVPVTVAVNRKVTVLPPVNEVPASVRYTGRPFVKYFTGYVLVVGENVVTVSLLPSMNTPQATDTVDGVVIVPVNVKLEYCSIR